MEINPKDIMSATKRYPNENERITEYQARLGGISIILAQILYIIYWLFHLDTALYEWPYDVNTNDDLINLHLLLSSTNFKTKIKLSIACLWISFPFHLIGISIHTKNLRYFNRNYSNNLIAIYVLEKAYLMWVLILCLIVPAFEIVMISHDWNLLDTNNDFANYVQLNLVLMKFEIIDCIQLCDLVFMVVTLLLMAYNVYNFESIKSIVIPHCCRYIFVPFLITLSVFVLITCLVVLFEFADSGIFAMDSPLQLIICWLPIIRIVIGFRYLWLSRKNNLQLIDDTINSGLNPYKTVNESDPNQTNETNELL